MKDLDGNWQVQNFDTGAAESVLFRSYAESIQQLSGRQSAGRAVRPVAAAASSSGSPGEQNTDMDVVSGAGVSAQARAERNGEGYGEIGAGASAQSAAEGREEDDEFQRPRSVRFYDEQM